MYVYSMQKRNSSKVVLPAPQANEFALQLEASQGYAGVFELVKTGVHRVLGARRAGLMLGIADMGASPSGFIGAYYPVDSNLIVLNRTALDLFTQTHPHLRNSFLFHLLVHEYLHSLGMHDEQETRRTTHYVCQALLGEAHPATDIAANPAKYVPQLQFGVPGSEVQGVELVHGFDRESLSSYS